MTRLRRVIAVNMPHHLTQRGNARQFILNRDEDRAVYLKLLRENTEAHEVSLLGYCLMSNHVHRIAARCQMDLCWRLGMLMAGTPHIGTRSMVQAGTLGRGGSMRVLSTKHTYGQHCVARNRTLSGLDSSPNRSHGPAQQCIVGKRKQTRGWPTACGEIAGRSRLGVNIYRRQKRNPMQPPSVGPHIPAVP